MDSDPWDLMVEVPGLVLESPDTEDITGLLGTLGTSVLGSVCPSWCWTEAGGLGCKLLWLRLEEPGRDLSLEAWVMDRGCLGGRGREE